MVVSLLAFFTPLLPLDPPDRDQTKLQYEMPRLLPLLEESFSLNMEQVRATPTEVHSLRGELAQAESRLAAAQEMSDEDRADLQEEVRRLNTAVEDTVQRPFRDAGYPDLGPLARQMVVWRQHLFRGWTVGPLCGRDLL